MSESRPPTLLVPGNRPRIDLSRVTDREGLGRDLQNAEVVGCVANWDFPSSSHQCEFLSTRFENIRFFGKDFRDCTFRNVNFVGCEFHKASIIGCVYVDCLFNGTKIDDYSIHDCIITGTEFIQSDINGSMIRYSRIQRCQFTRCNLENKLFDECLLFDIAFDRTNIDLRVLVDNFGLSNQDLAIDAIREDRSLQLGQERMFEFNDSNLERLRLNLSVIERFRLQAYLAGDLLFHGPIMDDLLAVENWLDAVTTPSAFIRLLENLTEYVVREFDSGRCYVYLIARLHHVMFLLYQNLEAAGYSSVAHTAIGAHLRLGQVLARTEYSAAILGEQREGLLRFVTEDSISEDEANDTLKQLDDHITGISHKVGPRNSPLLVEIVGHIDKLLMVVVAFTLTRLSFEVERSGSASDEKELAETTKKTILALTVRDGAASLTASPFGDIVVTASLSLNSRFVSKLRRILREIASDTDAPDR